MAQAQRRLTEFLRSAIRERVLAMTFDEQFGALEKREDIIANKVADYLIGENNLRLIKQLPPSFFVARNRIQISNKDDNIVLKTCEHRPLPTSLCNNYVELPATNGMWKEIRAIRAERDVLFKEREELRVKVNTMLASVQSVRKLLEVWPEAESYLPTAEEETKNLPTVRAEDLNAMISKFGKK